MMNKTNSTLSIPKGEMRWTKTEIRTGDHGYHIITTWVNVVSGWEWFQEVREYAFSTWGEVREYLDRMENESYEEVRAFYKGLVGNTNVVIKTIYLDFEE